MKRILPVILLLACLSCLKEETADPGKASTFVRYFNGGFDDQAHAFEQLPDGGFLILATTQVTDNLIHKKTKIKLIRTDRYGNTVKQTLYPAFGDPLDNTLFLKGRGMIVEKGTDGEVTGYTIVGDEINITNGESHIYIMKTDADGNFLQSKKLLEDSNNDPLTNVQGQSIAKDANGDYLVLGFRTDGVLEDMVLIKLDKTTLNPLWSRLYGEGGSLSVTGLLTNNDNNSIYWTGTVARATGTDMRLITTVPDSPTAFNPLIGRPEFNEETGGMCYSPINSRINIVGTTDEKGNRDIIFKQLTADGSGTVVTSKIIDDENEIPEEGNAICTTKDGGVLIIGNSGIDEESKNYYLIKLNFAGEVKWSKIFGSKKADKGVGVMQASDGSYVILGSTILGGLNSIMLMKTDSKGNIE